MGKRRKKKFYTGPNLTEQHNFYIDQKLTVLIEKYDSNGVGVGFYKDIPIVVFTVNLAVFFAANLNSP